MMTDVINTPKAEKFHSYKTMKMVSKILAYVLLGILSIIWIYPLLWIVICSFVTTSSGNPTPVPNTFFPDLSKRMYNFQNYINLFTPEYKNGKFTIVIRLHQSCKTDEYQKIHSLDREGPENINGRG